MKDISREAIAMEFENVRDAIVMLLAANEKGTQIITVDGESQIDALRDLNKSALMSICDLLGYENLYLDD